eukprot:10255428-Ditylum_brightwellii.AAC.1
MSHDQKLLQSAKEELQRAKRNLEKEEQIWEDAQLKRQFDDAIWPGEHTNAPLVEKWSHEQVAD